MKGLAITGFVLSIIAAVIGVAVWFFPLWLLPCMVSLTACVGFAVSILSVIFSFAGAKGKGQGFAVAGLAIGLCAMVLIAIGSFFALQALIPKLFGLPLSEYTAAGLLK